MVYCAGQVGADVNREPAIGLEAQARLAFSNVRSCLTAAGASVHDVVKLTYYVVGWGPEKAPLFRKALMEFLTDETGAVHRPPSTLISVPGLADPRWLVEIDAVAAIKG
jgi:enamine deaminase RidA (YjgF/YER057c/UK114 family)